MCSGVSWEVFDAKGRQGGMGGARPCATLCIREDGRPRYVSIPTRVARALKRKGASEGVAASSADELLHAVDELSRRVAKNRVAEMLMRREHSSMEVRDRLRKDGFSMSVVNEVVQESCSTGLISDSRFADSFVRSKLSAGWGLKRIERGLSERGIQADTLSGWPYAYADPSDELARALEVGSRKHVREPNAYAKLARFLVGRGFSYAVAGEAARKLLEA